VEERFGVDGERDKEEELFSDFGGFWWESGVQILDGRSRKLLVSCSLFYGEAWTERVCLIWRMN